MGRELGVIRVVLDGRRMTRWRCKFGRNHDLDEECRCTDEDLAVDEWNERERVSRNRLFEPNIEELERYEKLRGEKDEKV